MNRELMLKVVLVLVGLIFSAAIYPVTMILWQRDRSGNADAMMGSIYFALGIFLLLAARNPSAHRSLIAFTAWSSFAHATVMAILGFRIANERTDLLAAAVFFVIGGALIALAPPKQSGTLASAAGT